MSYTLSTIPEGTYIEVDNEQEHREVIAEAKLRRVEISGSFNHYPRGIRLGSRGWSSNVYKNEHFIPFKELSNPMFEL